ncbi:sulfite exporter TauE/SafE family protein [Rhodococcus sp. USK10]|nr:MULTISPECIES: sulfite exporter TauE/SafE family protein [Rhodococcus]QYB00829.1 sulfite exporter TauE/SafE family protein [Rhodococcus sp. USK10]
MAATVWDLSLPALLFALGIVVAGGVVRGFGGFGGAMVWVAGLVVLLPPTSVIPTVFVLEVVASAAMLPQVWRQVHWKSLRWLFAGTLIGMPLGMWALTQLSGDLVRVLLGVAIIGSAVAMAAVPDRQSLPGPGVTAATGVASGLLNGGFALGGPPAVLMYFSASTHVAAGRASLVVFFLVIDAFGAAGSAAGGLLTVPVLAQIALFTPLCMFGAAAGKWMFDRTTAHQVRQRVLWLLGFLGAAVLVQVALR